MAGHDNSTEDSASAETQEQPAVVVRLLGCVARVFAMIVLLGMVAWAAALNYSTLPTTLRPIAAVVMAVGGLWAVLRASTLGHEGRATWRVVGRCPVLDEYQAIKRSRLGH